MTKKELVMARAYKSNNVILRNSKDYISKIKLIFANTSNFKKIQIDDSKVLNHLILIESRYVQLLKKLKESMKLLVKAIIIHTLQAQDQVIYMVFVKSTKLFLLISHLLVLYFQLL